jgi:hypothetical protein
VKTSTTCYPERVNHCACRKLSTTVTFNPRAGARRRIVSHSQKGSKHSAVLQCKRLLWNKPLLRKSRSFSAAIVPQSICICVLSEFLIGLIPRHVRIPPPKHSPIATLVSSPGPGFAPGLNDHSNNSTIPHVFFSPHLH